MDGVMTSWLVLWALDSSPGQGYCVVFLGKTLFSTVSHSASVHHVQKWIPVNLMVRANPVTNRHPIQEGR